MPPGTLTRFVRGPMHNRAQMVGFILDPNVSVFIPLGKDREPWPKTPTKSWAVYRFRGCYQEGMALLDFISEETQ